jgi:hypothetical protein
VRELILWRVIPQPIQRHVVLFRLGSLELSRVRPQLSKLFQQRFVMQKRDILDVIVRLPLALRLLLRFSRVYPF